MYFDELYQAVLDASTESPSVSAFSALLRPALPELRTELAPLARHAAPAPATNEDLWDWYALSRVNDLLLLAFQPRPSTSVRELAESRFSPHLPPKALALELSEYVAFYEGLGFTPFVPSTEAFNPFFHEIVEIVSDEGAGQPTINEPMWPGLMFGQLLFSRAGVRVRANSRSLDATIGVASTLYFSFWRAARCTSDLSHGWGHNSQWRTEFRRDYSTPSQLIYNFDGTVDLASHSTWNRRPSGGFVDEELTKEERLELLIHRSFVRCRKPSDNRWPWDDTYTHIRDHSGQ